MDKNYNPITDPSPEQIPLNNPPLDRVLVQISFPPVLSVEDLKFVAPFQESIRRKYPNVQPEQTQEFIIGLNGINMMAPQMQKAWRFSDIEGNWRVSLTSNFLALETRKYDSRTDFIARLSELVKAVAEHIEPQMCIRIGIRYITRLVGSPLSDINSLIRTEMLGVSKTKLSEHLDLVVSQAQFSTDDNKLIARWGTVPANSSVDLSVIDPIPEASWVLDLDMSVLKNQAFDNEKILSKVEDFSAKIYAFFRWTVTDKFIEHYKK